MSFGKTTTADTIIEDLVSISGLFDKVFGKLLPQLVFDRRIDDNINYIEEVYGFDDAREIFPRRIDRKEFGKLTKVVFRYVEYQRPPGSPPVVN